VPPPQCFGVLPEELTGGKYNLLYRQTSPKSCGARYPLGKHVWAVSLVRRMEAGYSVGYVA
jgi:hypothetical protein